MQGPWHLLVSNRINTENHTKDQKNRLFLPHGSLCILEVMGFLLVPRVTHAASNRCAASRPERISTRIEANLMDDLHGGYDHLSTQDITGSGLCIHKVPKQATILGV